MISTSSEMFGSFYIFKKFPGRPCAFVCFVFLFAFYLRFFFLFLNAGRYDGLESLVSVGYASQRVQRWKRAIRNGFQLERFNQRRRKKEETISSQRFAQTLSFTCS
jgi:hypothetical protein